MRYTDSFIRKFLSKKHKINKIWKALAGIMAIIVTFSVTYSLIMPAITVSRDQADEIAGLYLDDSEEVFDIVEDGGDEDELWTSEDTVIQHAGAMEDDWDGILIEEETEDETEETGSGIELEEPAQSENLNAHYTYEQELSTDTEAETTAAIELDSEDEEETETESQIEISVETESETEVETESETESETEIQTESETESETEIQTESEIHYPAQRFTASEGGVLIIVNAPESAFPEGTTMTVSHVNDKQTLKGIEEAAQTDEKHISRIEAVDICFRDADGNEIEPKAPVSVCMITENKASKEDPVVVHVDDDGHAETVQDAEVYTTGTHDQIVLTANGSAANQAEAETEAEAINESSATAAKTAIEFETEQFSIYAVVYTVDFEYSVNGKMYQFSLPGGGFVSFTDLVEVLGIIGDTNSEENGSESGAVIAENAEENAANDVVEENSVNFDTNTALTLGDVEVSEATRKFVADVASVEFSTPSLVDVSKVEADTTVGQIKEGRGLECEYSFELTEEQITEINSSTVAAGDWALISMQPFTSEETLTVTMKDGEVFTIRVTDAQISKDYVSAAGEKYKITVTFDDDAEIPDGSELVVGEILPDNGKFSEYYQKALEKITGEDIVSENPENSYARFFDIEIRNKGQKIEPKAAVGVKIELQDIPENAKPAVIHFEQNQSATEPVVMDVDTENPKDIRFETDSFSVYGVIADPGPSGVTDLDGKTFTISRDSRYLMTTTGDIGNNGNGAIGFTKGNESDAPVWQFEQVSGNTYHIFTMIGDQKKYMHLEHYGYSRANASLSDAPQDFIVDQVNGGYRLSAYSNNTRYYLDEHNGTSGNGFAGYAGISDNGILTFNFTQLFLENNQEYMVVVKRNEDGVNKYYVVLNDGTLKPVQYNESDKSVMADDPMLWTYTGTNIYHHSMQVAYDGNKLPTDFYYRYIDPTAEKGWSEDPDSTPLTPDGQHVTSRPQMSTTALTYENNLLRSTVNTGQYIGVAEENGALKIKGQASQDEAVEIFFADAVRVPGVGWTHHTVNHIDISVQGTANADVPLAYGKYYDADHNVVLEVTDFKKLKLTEKQVADPEQLEITLADMKRSSITATVPGPNGPVELQDAFYLAGYSANDVYGDGSDPSQGSDTVQVRIEGSFKVANLDGTEYEEVDANRYNNPYDRDYYDAVNAARLNNKVTYTVTVVKPITFNLQMPDPNDTSDDPAMIQLYDADGNPLSVTADVAFAASFDFWDTRNECPPLRTNDYGFGYDKWQAGEIWQIVDRIGGCGMDFRLGADTTAQSKVYAVEITKLVVDENGNRIKSYDAGTNTFNIYKSTSVTSDDIKDLNIGAATTDPLVYSDYVLQHSKSISIGNDGLGLVYDYDVTPGVYYISEDPDSITEHITDTSGKGWDYKETYILTEYAWRNHPNDNYMHVSPTYSNGQGSYGSVPEILGDHPGYSDGQTYTNDFLEFYVYNVYESPKVDVPVIKAWPDFDGEGHENYDWQASFKLQWAPLYEGEARPSVSFQDVTPVQTMTINKSDMDGITQELINRYLSGDTTLTQQEIDKIEAITFKNLPKYGTDSNGNTFRYQYSLEETSYRVINASTGVILYSWSETDGYNDPDESTHYHPFYPHDAGETEEGNTAEENEADTNYYVDVTNALRNISQKEYIDVTLDKQWDINDDGTPDTRDESYWAEFELRRFVHTEYCDISHMSDADRTADPVTITIKNGDTVVDTLEVQPNVGLYLGGNFLPHNTDQSAVFTSDHPVRLANDSRVSTLTVTAAGENQSNALVRSQEFFVTQDTVFTITSGQDVLVASQMARVLDTGAGTTPIPDRSYRETIRLDSSNNWHVAFDDLIRSETSAGDDDDQENVTFYEYYLVEKESNPKGFAQYFRADSSGNPTTVLSGDSDHQIEHDDMIVAVNGPSNRLIVKKYWRGVPDTTGFPAVKFTLYQAWADGNEGWVYENENTHARYEHIELKGNSLEWICPETLPSTKLDGSTSRAVKYYVVEDVREGSATKDGITTSWQFYYYINSKGQQTNAGHQGYFAALNGSDLAEDGGTITICNKMNNYMQLDIQKQFFKLEEAGSWNNVTATSDMKRNAILGFKVIRAIKAPDGKWLDASGNESNVPVWRDYSEEMLCGYDENGNAVVYRGENDIFWLHDAGGDWHFRIEDNQGDATNVDAGGAGLPGYGFYIKNGEDIPVEYWYCVRETNVYKDLNRTPYPEWDWFSSITPVKAYGPTGTMDAFPKAFHGQDEKRIANFQASDLIIDKEWIGDPAASAVYVKIWRTSGDGAPEDFTSIIANDIRNNQNWQMYVNDPAEIDLNRNALIVRPDSSGIWENSIKVNRALLGALSETGKYHYYIQEVGYRTLSGEYRTNVNGTFKPLYDKWVGTADGGAYTGAPVGMNDYAGNSITIGAKGENRLKVTNRTSPSTSYTVTKAFYGKQNSTGGQSSVTGRYPTDGSKQVVVMLQQRYRYEKTEGGVDYVSADHENWVRADSSEAAETWCNYASNEGWQAAESASPGSVALPLDKPEGSILSDEAWYGSAAAWSYTWEGLDVTKVVSEAADPADSLIAQLYYRAVEVSTPDWFNSVIAAEEQDGHQAIDDNTQGSAGVLSEKNTVTNEREECTLELNKEWTGLGTGTTWPSGYVVYYQLIQNFHLAGVNLNGGTPEYYYGEAIKKVNMVKPNSSMEGLTNDSVHPQATGTLEEGNHNLSLDGLPLYGFFTASEEDVTAAAEKGVTLTAGTVYPVVYTYSVKETAVKKNGVDVDFTEQTVDFTEKTADGQQLDGDDGQTGDEGQESGDQSETTETGAVYEATLTNEMVSVDVTKTWANNTPYADSVTVKLYRTTEIPADELCLTTINLSFGNNYEKITDSSITATVGGKTVSLVKDGDNDLWTGTVRLEKGTTPTISFTDPQVAEGYTVTLNDSQFTVDDAETQTVNVSGLVTEQQDGRTITVNVTWLNGNNPGASYHNLFYSGWSGTGITAATSSSGNTQTFIWSGVPTTGNNLFVQLGYNGYNLQNSFNVNVTGSGHSFNANGAELLLGDIAAGDSNVTINVSVEAKGDEPEGTGSITLVNNSGRGIWINQLSHNVNYGNFGGWMESGNSNTISNLPAGEFTVQLGVATFSQISGAESVDQWGDSAQPNVNIHIILAEGENRTITVNAPVVANVLGRLFGILDTGVRPSSARLTGDIPVLNTRAIVPSSTTVAMEHEASDTTLVIEGADDYPAFTQADFVEEQILNAGNNWHYQWTGLAASDPETGAKYYYYVVEEVPGNTKEVKYTRNESNNNTVVTINNTPVTIPQYASLKVIKSVVDENNTPLEISREFTIRLKRGDQYLRWTSNSDYGWVSSLADASTWTFNNGGSVTFTGLDTGYTYTVEEDTSTGKIEIENYTFVSTTTYTVTASAASQHEGTITNTYRLNNIDLNILKVDASDMTTPLKDAQFTLIKLDPEGKGTYLTGDGAVTKVSGLTKNDGATSISDIEDGYYEISETKVPAGYVLVDDGKIYIHISNRSVSLLTKDTSKIVTEWETRTLTENDKLQYNAETYTLTVGNTPGAALPHTGGPGTRLFTILGSILILGAGVLLWRRRRTI